MYVGKGLGESIKEVRVLDGTVLVKGGEKFVSDHAPIEIEVRVNIN
jgi:hypothetical protein